VLSARNLITANEGGNSSNIIEAPGPRKERGSLRLEEESVRSLTRIRERAELGMISGRNNDVPRLIGADQRGGETRDLNGSQGLAWDASCVPMGREENKLISTFTY